MTLYLDTSALVKRYIREKETDEVHELCRRVESISVSIVAYAEALGTFSRKVREGNLSRQEYLRVSQCFKEEYSGFGCIYLTPQLNQPIEQVLQRHPLRSFDAIHLASALSLKWMGVDVVFGCFDKTLNAAARHEGFSLAFE